MPSLSVIVPCYNEAPGVVPLRDRLEAVLPGWRARGAVEIVLVDDGSRDGTGDALEAAFRRVEGARVVRHAVNRGLGAAVRTGVAVATGERVAFLDSDCTYDPEIVEKLLAALDAGAEVATVSPYHPLGGVEGVPGWRLLLSRGAALAYSLATGRRLHTWTALVRAHPRALARALEGRAEGFPAVAEAMVRAVVQGRRVAEVPAVLRRRRFGESKLRTARVIRGHLRLLARLALDRRSFVR